MTPGFGRGALTLSLGYAARTLAYFALTILMTQALGPSGYGEVSLFIAITAGSAYLATAWLMPAVPLYVGRGFQLSAAIRAVRRTATLPTAVALIVMIPVLGIEIGWSGTFLAAGTSYFLAQIGLQAVFASWQSLGRMRRVAFTQAAERIIALLFVGTVTVTSALSVKAGIVALALSCAFSAVVLALPLVRAWRGATSQAPSRLQVCRDVGPMALVYACSLAVATIDVLLLGLLSSNHQVGRYALGYQIYTLLLQYGSLWIALTLPRAAGIEPGARYRVDSTQLRSGNLLWGGVVVLVAVTAPSVLAPVFGQGFHTSGGPLTVLLLGALPLAGYFAAVPLAMMLDQRGLALVSVVSAGLNVLLDLALIPAIGAYGPAVATAAYSLIATVWILARSFGLSQAVRQTLVLAPLVPVIASTTLLAPGAGELAIGLLVVLFVWTLGIRGLRTGPAI